VPNSTQVLASRSGNFEQRTVRKPKMYALHFMNLSSCIEFDLSWSRDAIDHVSIRFHHRQFPIGVPIIKPLGLSLTVSEIFNGECDTMANMTLNGLYAKVKVIHFGTNRFLIGLYTTSCRLSKIVNFCSRKHCLATIHNVADREKNGRT